MTTKAQWSDQLLLNIFTIDEQHKYLFLLINQIVSSQGKELESGLEMLLDYTRVHFEDEETLMKLVEFPDYERHKGLHQAFIKRLEETNANMLQQPSERAAFESFLSNWLTQHIMCEDMKIKSDY